MKALEKKASPRHKIEKRVTKDGLVVDVVKRRKPHLIPFKSLIAAALFFVLCKGFLLARIGEAEYQQRIQALQQGDSMQVAAAFLLDADPATKALANFLNQNLRGF